MKSYNTVILKLDEQDEISEGLINLLRLQEELDERLKKLAQRLLIIEE